MKLNITEEAANWYIKEMDLTDGDSLKFFGKVYGKNGFSIALAVMKATRPEASTTINGVTFYVERADAWFFEGHDLSVTLDSKLKEPNYEMV